jgi:hypothetical protein
MVQVNNLESDYSGDTAKIMPDSLRPDFNDLRDLGRSIGNSGALPKEFNNDIHIIGLDCKMPGSYGIESNMPIMMKGDDISSNMPVLQSRGDSAVSMPVLRAPEFLDINPPCYGTGDSGSLAEDNYRSFNQRETPRFQGNGNWAPLEGLADPKMGAVPDEYVGEKPSTPGTGNWAPLENYSIANRDMINVDEDPRFEGTGNWAPLEGYSLAVPKTHAHPDLAEGRLPLEGTSIRDLDPEINPRLGCALAVSASLHEIDPSFPITNNNKQLAQLLKKHGYEAVPQNGVDQANMEPGDVVIGTRPAGMPGHSAIYKGEGRVFENNSDTGTISGDGNFDQFKSKMHDASGRWNKNGFSEVAVYRKVPVVGTGN